jgi:SAM-dependent methyltransferase
MKYRYVGSELEVFATASNWKTYISHIISNYLGERVLEVGAGIGTNIPYLYRDAIKKWIALEPDAALAARIAERVNAGDLPESCCVVNGTITQIAPNEAFDTILYIDVLEHIADDAAEVARAARHLSPSGYLVILSPAHQYLFSSFDAAIGHYRRYTVAALKDLTPSGCRLVRWWMLDSAGFFVSLANRFLLRSPAPAPRQIAFWDRLLVPISHILDRMTGYRFGKTIVGVWCCNG